MKTHQRKLRKNYDRAKLIELLGTDYDPNLAAQFGLSVGYIRRLREQRKIPGYKPKPEDFHLRRVAGADDVAAKVVAAYKDKAEKAGLPLFGDITPEHVTKVALERMLAELTKE